MKIEFNIEDCKVKINSEIKIEEILEKIDLSKSEVLEYLLENIPLDDMYDYIVESCFVRSLDDKEQINLLNQMDFDVVKQWYEKEKLYKLNP